MQVLKSQAKSVMSSSSSSSSGGKCRQISLEEIIQATDNFHKSNVIGRGGEGKVYLAKIKLGPDSEITPLAVKRLKAASKQFDVEIKIMSNIQHPNLVSLLGYCDKAGEKMLLYEYMENGSLSNYLEKKSRISMSWQVRVSICIDAARGLRHLHAKTNEFSKGIIHRDVKPDNILLDKYGVAKISDFGLFKLSKRVQKQSEMGTCLQGTGGYLAPEYITYGRVTRKIDVYAFGVVLYQVLCLKRPWERGDDQSYFYTGDEEFALLALENVDPTIKDEITDDSLEIFTNIIGKSMKKDPRERPTMDSVVSSLLKVGGSLKSKGDEYEAKQVQAATEPDNDHSTGGSYYRGESEEGKTSEAIVLDVVRYITKAEFAEFDNTKAVSQSHPIVFELDELMQATDCFDDAKLIVREDFAVTYEGFLKDGRTVAVKRYQFNSFEYIGEFLNEIHSFSKYQIDYIVSIIGLCIESGELILVHEFMKNRTLAYHLLEKESFLSWDQRLRICIDVAKGLEFLHSAGISFSRIYIHRNVNPFTILLNEQWGAKLSDFGSQNIAPANTYHSAVKSGVKGNMIKYVDPHYQMTGRLFRKSEVYSFGIVLFDVLFGMEYIDGGSKDREYNVRQWSQKFLNDHRLDKIDERLKGKISLQCFKEFVKVASSCVYDNPASRPTMTSIVEKLESALKISNQTQPS